MQFTNEPTTASFLKDLETFLRNHAIAKTKGAELTVENHEESDNCYINISTPDGDYERITIRVNFIS